MIKGGGTGEGGVREDWEVDELLEWTTNLNFDE